MSIEREKDGRRYEMSEKRTWKEGGREGDKMDYS